jgi:hypothetical protein
VVASQDYGCLAGLQSLQHQFSVLSAGSNDFFQILGPGMAFLLLLGEGDGDVAGVFHHKP